MLRKLKKYGKSISLFLLCKQRLLINNGINNISVVVLTSYHLILSCYRPQTKFGVRQYFYKRVSFCPGVGACMAGGMHSWGGGWEVACVAGGMCGRGCAWQGKCTWRGLRGRRVRGRGGGMHGRGGACMAGETATTTGGPHPIGMHSCGL